MVVDSHVEVATRIRMIGSFIDQIPDERLNDWSWYMTVATIVVPAVAALIAGFTGYAAVKINDRITAISSGAAETLRTDLREAQDSAADARARATALEERGRPRKVATEVRQRMVSELSAARGSPVTVSSIMSDAESFEFASTMKDILIESGWIVGDIKTVMTTPPLKGVRLDIRSVDSIPPYAAVLQHALINAGFGNAVNLNETLSPGTVQLTVGAKP